MGKLNLMLVVVAGLFIILPGRARADNADEIRTCLQTWGHSPFTEKSPFRVVSAKVKIMGIGGDINQSATTAKPELVLIRPSVAVMTKTTMTLNNPNGWYCLKGKVTVLGKTEINLNCKAHLASSDGATVLGGSDEDTGTTVLGSTRVNRIGSCAGKKAE